MKKLPVKKIPAKLAKLAKTQPLLLAAACLLLVAASAGAYATLGGFSGSSINLQDGLVGHWKFNEDLSDSSTYSNDATAHGGSFGVDRKRQSNRAYSLLGNGDYVDVAHDQILEPDQQITISMWVQPDTWSNSAYNTLIEKRVDGPTDGYFIFKHQNTNTINIDIGGHSGNRWDTGYLPPVGEWTLLSVTHDGASMILYVNGQYYDSSNKGIMAQVPSGGTLDFGSAGYRYNGSVDDVRIYNRSLDDTEIEALYNSYDPTGQPVDLQKDLVGHWKLDGNANDSAGSQNGTVNGPIAAADRTGNTNMAYSFDGTDDWIDLHASGSYYNVNPGQVKTYSIWFKGGAQTNGGVMFWKEGGCIGWYLQLHSNGHVYFSNNTGDSPCSGVTHFDVDSSPSGKNFADNEWHLATGVTDRSIGTVKLYVDGELVASRNDIDTDRQGSGGNLRIGTQWNTSLWFDGELDDARIYDRGLSAAEVKALYDTYDPPVEVQLGDISKGLVGHWKLDGDANDSTPYGNHGSINGATASADRKGQSSKAYSFDGNDYIEFDTGEFLPGGAGSEMTIFTWVKSNNAGVIAEQWDTSSNNRKAWDLWPHNFRINDIYGGEQSCNYSSAVPNDGSWHSLAATYSDVGNFVRVYINGSVVCDESTTITMGATQPNHFHFGAKQSGPGYQSYFDGSIDDFRVYDRVLSIDEMNYLRDSNDANIRLSDLSKGLIGHWRLDGNGDDRTPYSNTGTVNGATPTTDRNGRVNGAFSFDGVDDRINTSSTNEIYDSAEITVSVWIRVDLTQPSPDTWIVGDGGRYRLGVRSDQGDFKWWLRESGGGTSTQLNGGSLNAGEWQHVVGVYSTESGVRSLYVDGALAGSSNIGYTLGDGADNQSIGTGYSTYGPIKGDIDDVRIYNRALTEPEVQALYDLYN